MLRSHTCGELTKTHLNKEVTLSGWVQKIRNKGFIVWVDLRDRYGMTQLVFDEQRTPKDVFKKSLLLGFFCSDILKNYVYSYLIYDFI